MTSKLTREQLIEKIKHRIAVTEKYPHLEEARIDSQIFKIALAAMDCEPVAYIFKHPAGRLFWALTDESNKGQSDVMPVYAAPQPPPVVPEEWAISDAVKFCKETGRQDAGTAMDAWNACRAAMLQAGTLTNEDTRQVDELTMWIKRLVRSLKKASPDSKLHSEAMDYLTAKGLISVGDALR